MQKRGQFYLIAALVIVGIIAGLAGVYNFAKVSENNAIVYDLTSEIDYEASQVIDNGIFFNETSQNLSIQLENLTDYYSSANLGSDLLVIYGNETMLAFVFYNNSETGSIGVVFGDTTISFTQSETTKYKSSSFYEPGDSITIILPPGVEYNFKLSQGQIFFIVLRKEFEGQSFVSASDKSQQQTE